MDSALEPSFGSNKAAALLDRLSLLLSKGRRNSPADLASRTQPQTLNLLAIRASPDWFYSLSSSHLPP
jgi:hypothetical protein